MTEKNKLTEITNETERSIIELIDRKGKCLLGEILMKLKLSYENGYNTINSLKDKDIISNTKEPPYFTLKIKHA